MPKMKFCKDCKFFSTPDEICTHPKALFRSWTDLVKGVTSPVLSSYAKYMRADTLPVLGDQFFSDFKTCGPYAKWFEPK